MKSSPQPIYADAELSERRCGQYYAFVEQALRNDAPNDANHILAEEFVEHGNGGARSRAEFLASFAVRRQRFPAAVWTIQLLTSMGELVVCHATMTSVSSDGVGVSAQETSIVRFVDARVVECWRTFEEASMQKN